MKSPKDLVDRSSELRDLRKLRDDDGLMRDTFTLPLNAARLKARQILNERGQRLRDRCRKLAPASRRSNRIHDAAVFDAGPERKSWRCSNPEASLLPRPPLERFAKPEFRNRLMRRQG
jgi:hypothetical protein